MRSMRIRVISARFRRRPRSYPASPPGDAIADSHPGWRWLRDTYGLDERELDLVLLVLAPEVDLGYSRLYGLLLDKVTSSRPTVGLLLEPARQYAC